MSNENITDTERLEFMAKYMENLHLGYPTVLFVGEEKRAEWGYSSVYNRRFLSIEQLRETIDNCIAGYQRHLKYEKNKSFYE